MKTKPPYTKFKNQFFQMPKFIKEHSHVSKTDLIGIGIGPFNLSLAALLEPIKSLKTVFFDKRSQFTWHEGLLFKDADLQVHYLKDLVSLVDPTNKFSFLNFLACNKRLYHFITANFPRVSRREFSQYFNWASRLLHNLHYNSHVKEIRFDTNSLVTRFEQRNHSMEISAPNVAIGIGLQPYVPPFAQNHLGSTLYHAANYLFQHSDLTNKKVIVIGGGQTGAEVVRNLINNHAASLQELVWLSRRDNFIPIDESPFVNDLFTPSYSNHFYNQSDENKKNLLTKQRLFSDGISSHTLEEIYRELYSLKFLANNTLTCSLLPSVDVVGIKKNTNNWELQIKNTTSGSINIIYGDVIIFCTGYRYQFPEFLSPLQNRLYKDVNGNLSINSDFSLNWDGPQHCKLYIQNGASHCRGVADPNLSLMAWRSATIINAITKKNIYAVDNQGSFIDWHTPFYENNHQTLTDNNNLKTQKIK